MIDYSKIFNFESLKSNPFDGTTGILTDKFLYSDLNFYDSNFENLDTPHISQEKHKNLNENAATATFSILDLNIRSIKKCRKFQTFLI